MESAKIFTNGGSQAVRLPKDCRFDKDEVFVKKIGNVVILMQKEDMSNTMMTALKLFTEDCFREGVEDLPLQEREF